MKRKTKRKYAHELNVGDTFVKFNNVKGTSKEFTIKEIESSNGYEAFYIIDTNDEKWMLAYMSVMFVVKQYNRLPRHRYIYLMSKKDK